MKIFLKKLKGFSSLDPEKAEQESYVRANPTTVPIEVPRPTPRPPVPSKVAVLLYFVSCMFITIGVVASVRYGFFIKNGTAKGMDSVLYLGLGMISTGLVLTVIMNYLNNREHKRVVAYVDAKAREMVNDVNSRQRFNAEYSDYIPEGQPGPNGVK